MYFPVSSLLIEYLILTIVQTQDSYGYEISQTIKLAADIKESTLYPIHQKCWRNPVISPPIPSCTKDASASIIRLPQLGKQQIQQLHEEWVSYRDTIEGIIEGRLRK